MADTDDKITVENVNTPGRTTRVNRAKYEDMRLALVSTLPSEPPGMKVADALSKLRPKLDQGLFPEGATSGWWQKTVQLDLEAKGMIARTETKPLHIYKLQDG